MANPLNPIFPLIIDGSHGEGGGQILRTAITLSAIQGRPIHLVNIRKNRPKPGLAAQHLTAVRATGSLCSAKLKGDTIGSTELEFIPQSPPRAGEYFFNVAEARIGGSAGAASLVLQTILLPLVFSVGTVSTVRIQGGTHLTQSPSFDYIQSVWLWALQRMGVQAQIELIRTGWYPAGQGELLSIIRSKGPNTALIPFSCAEKGALHEVWGRALTANLPFHISDRMAYEALSRLSRLTQKGISARILPERVRATTAGAAILLTAEYENARAGFGVIGARGLPAEKVADEAIEAFFSHHYRAGALDLHLADQLILPAALAQGPSTYSVEKITRHLITNAWVVEQFEVAHVQLEGRENHPGKVIITPTPVLAQAA